MAGLKKFLVRTPSGEVSFETEEKLREAFLAGQVKGGWLVQFWADKSWRYVCDVPMIAAFFSQAPGSTVIEPRNVHVYVPGPQGYQAGPFSLSEMKSRVSRGEISPSNWVFMEGDSEWRQVKSVDGLREMISPLPNQSRGPGLAEGITGSGAESITAVPVAGGEEGGIPLGAAQDTPLGSVEGSSEAPEPQTNPSIKLDLQEAMSLEAAGQPLVPAAIPPAATDVAFDLPTPKAPDVSFAPMPAAAAAGAVGTNEAAGSKDGVDVESPTMAINIHGLNLATGAAKAPPPKPGVAAASPAPAKPAPPKPAAPPAASTAGSAVPAAPTASGLKEESTFEGIVAEVPMDPIWLVKQGTSETASGPYRFLDVVKFLKEGKLNKNDKISRAGTNRYQKISQQYEFSVAYSVETVVRGGVETQRIVIRRRHPRVAYMANVQIIKGQQVAAGTCVNISAGGVLVEVPKMELAVGDKLVLRLLPAVIQRPIQCSVTVMGKVPKIPPGYSLQFDDLKKEDKEAIEFFVGEALKKEQASKQNAAG